MKLTRHSLTIHFIDNFHHNALQCYNHTIYNRVAIVTLDYL